MKSIYLYSPYWRNMGGGERYMLRLATALSGLPSTDVIVLSDFPEITKENLQKYFMLDLSRVGYRMLEHARHSPAKAATGADIFVALSNFRRIDASPGHYVQALQIPYPKISTATVCRKIISGNLREGIKDILRRQLLLKSKECARLTLTNSVFVHDTLQRNFGLQSSVLHPPINDFLARDIPKQKIILSVGRFFRGLYNDKRYDLLTAAFRSMSARMQGWEYHIVGSAAGDDNTSRFIRDLKKANAGFPVFFHVNESHETLTRLYNQAVIMWHGAGFGVDEEQEPEKTEHFGMSVAEGLSARCIPVVVNRGGLKEIVKHGENGFLWDTTDQLTEYTLTVAGLSQDGLDSLRTKARERYGDFAENRFDERVAEIFSPILMG